MKFGSRWKIMPNAPEIWRDVIGFEGLYKVSDHGRVLSLERQTKVGIRGGGLLTPIIDKDGYQVVHLCGNGPQVSRKVHQLVLESFVEPCPEGMECRHFPDQNPSNNHLDNLRWDTRIKNQADRLVNGTSSRGERGGRSKLTEVDIERIRDIRLVGGQTYLTIAKYFDVSDRTVGRILKRQAWQHV